MRRHRQTPPQGRVNYWWVKCVGCQTSVRCDLEMHALLCQSLHEQNCGGIVFKYWGPAPVWNHP